MRELPRLKIEGFDATLEPISDYRLRFCLLSLASNQDIKRSELALDCFGISFSLPPETVILSTAPAISILCRLEPRLMRWAAGIPILIKQRLARRFGERKRRESTAGNTVTD